MAWQARQGCLQAILCQNRTWKISPYQRRHYLTTPSTLKFKLQAALTCIVILIMFCCFQEPELRAAANTHGTKTLRPVSVFTLPFRRASSRMGYEYYLTSNLHICFFLHNAIIARSAIIANWTRSIASWLELVFVFCPLFVLFLFAMDRMQELLHPCIECLLINLYVSGLMDCHQLTVYSQRKEFIRHKVRYDPQGTTERYAMEINHLVQRFEMDVNHRTTGISLLLAKGSRQGHRLLTANARSRGAGLAYQRYAA